MGWDIVRRLYPDKPCKHNRLWIKEEIEDILVNQLVTEATRSIKLEYSDLSPLIISKGLRNLKNLRFLRVYSHFNDFKNEASQYYLPDSLQSLYWKGYPFRCLPKTFQANKLIYLAMEHSNIRELWEGGERKCLNKLKFLNLGFSKLNNLDLGMTPHLENLNLQYCNILVDLHFPIECPNLKHLNLTGSKVRSLILRMTPHLKSLDLEGCNELVELHFPVEFPNLTYLNLSGTKASSLDAGITPHLEDLYLKGCIELVELQFPVECPNLKCLNAGHTKVRSLNLRMTPHLKKLDLGQCYELVELQFPTECPNLTYLDLSVQR
ncbi:hypothetical protein QVD17_27672 [Tagetes erecta]|uniref:Uncharacterized protein n=1 Tax=Tagetes erecta TaxID=13708 RepID=A0AAD8KDM6_TARER|nr:hypothetical protein QVD17_27672 [Tagetes erecta]